MDLSNLVIIILNYNNYGLTINAVENLTQYLDKVKIIIVDNYSTNDSFNILSERFKSDKHIDIISSVKNGGYSYGNNVGIQYACKKYNNIKYIVIMNPDIELKNTSTITSILDILEKNEDIAIASGLQIYNDKIFGPYQNYWRLPNKFTGIIDNSFINYFHKRKNISYDYKNNYFTVEVISGCFFMIKRKVFEELNIFDENVFLYFEENILSSKLKKLNYKAVISTDSIFYHNHINMKTKTILQQLNNKIITLKSKKYFYFNYVTSNLFLKFIFSVFSIIDFCITALIIFIMKLID